MKIKSVKILDKEYKSLPGGELFEFETNFYKDRLSTKVFAGLNGSGKSNFLELFSEIFYTLELCHLDTVSETEKKAGLAFEIEYYLPMVQRHPLQPLDFRQGLNFDMLVRVRKAQGELPEFSRIPFDKSQFERIDTGTEFLLPTKVIAYTSGQNEMLSNPYYKVKYHYFTHFENHEKEVAEDSMVNNHRLFFLDYSTNFSIFIANMLLAENGKVNILKDVLQINNLHSFRITLNTEDLYKKVIPVNDRLKDQLNKLKLCATAWIEKKVGSKQLLILDFAVNEATRQAFRFHFKTAFGLFSLFYELEIFNLFLVNRRTRDAILQSPLTLNINDEMPKPDPSRLVFRIEKIKVGKYVSEREPDRSIYYKGLSDGEHQFNEVVGTILMMEESGCLFLIDEPDTHFNPKWRAKLIKMLNHMAATQWDSKGNIEKVREQEIIITTHSPFVVSDSYQEDVYRFNKKNGRVYYEHPEIQTYGTTITVLLDEIFEKSETISEMAKKELKKLVEEVETMDDLRRVVGELNERFGDSVEKMDAFSQLRQIKEKLDQKKN